MTLGSRDAEDEQDRGRSTIRSPNSRRSRRAPTSSHLQGRERTVDTNSPLWSAFVGIDVSKNSWDVEFHPNTRRLALTANDTDLALLLAELKTLGNCLIVLEATGGYERTLVSALMDAGHHVAVVNPRQVRDFAKSRNILAKTDRLDAHVLALFAENVQPRTTPKTSEKQAELTELVARRRQVIGLQTAERNRQQQARKTARQSIERVLKVLKNELEQLEAAISKIVESDDDWRQRADLISSTPGIGKPTAHKLVADLPELGELNRQEIAKLVGTAPFNHDSGKKKGRRAIGGGRASVRAALYLPTMTAMRFNPAIRKVAERLTKAGKAHKVVVIACMRKLLTILNHMVKTNSLWIDKLAPTS